MKIVFMGTPDFAVPSLIKLSEDSEIEIAGVVTQPDRKKGRGQKLKPSPVKKKASELGLEIFQPENINNSDFVTKLNGVSPAAIVVVAFGQKIGSEILSLPEHGCINLHASLLPEYRGASPIHKVIINGEQASGVTTMYMDEDWDTGDIIYKQKVEIKKDDTVGVLHDKLAEIGAGLLVKTLIDVEKGTAPRVEQDDSKATYAYKLDKKAGEINWNQSAKKIYNLVRGVNPWPGAYTLLEGKILKVWETSIVDLDEIDNIELSVDQNSVPGEIISGSENSGLIVQTGEGLIKIEKLQLEGRKEMPAVDFLRGHQIKPGEKLG